MNTIMNTLEQAKENERGFDASSSYLPVLAALIFAGVVISYYPMFGLSQSQHVSGPELQYAVAIATLTIATFWNVILSGFVVGFATQICSPPEQRRRWLEFSAALVIGAILGLALPTVAGGPQTELFKAIRDAALINVNPIEIVNNGLASTSIAAILYSLWALTGQHNMQDPRRAVSSSECFTLSLYSAASLLAAGLFEIFSVFHWGWVAKKCTDNDLACTVTPQDFAVCAGILMSVLLIMMYVPAAIVMDRRIRALFDEAVKSNANLSYADWIKRVGMPTSPLKALTSYGAIFLPFITGILARILQPHVTS